MLNEKIEKALNDQIKMESDASRLYLSMSSWCTTQGLDGCAQFFMRQSEEEHMHMMKIFDYILEMDGHALVSSVEKPPANFDSIQSVFNSTLTHEQMVTKSIHNLLDLANELNDHSTHLFLQWYVEEQREEETLIRSIIDKIRLIGDGGMSLYYIDKEIEDINAAVAKATNV